MNHGPSAARGFMTTFLDRYPKQHDRQILFFPPALTFATVRDALHDRTDIGLGIQNIHWADKGAFTGELSAPIARDAGAEYVLVGHSERRHIFGETDQQCADKCAAAERAGLTPMLCVGETLEQRERGETESIVTRQLKAGLSMLAQRDVTTSLIAYEPVWAIGTGKTATPNDAAQIHAVLRNALADLVGDKASTVRILYGGSVTPANASSLLAAPNVDGLLVGGASLDPEGWSQIASASA